MTNYFSHDSNARSSEKLINLRISFGAEGYAIYFMILERLREEPEYMSIKDYNILAFDFRVGADKVKAVIEDFGLFSFTDDGKRFYSESFSKRMLKKDEKSGKARNSANERWKTCERNANAQNETCERNANAQKNDAIKGKKSKEKKSKENLESTTADSSLGGEPPDAEETVDYKKFVEFFNAQTNGAFGIAK